MEITVVERIAVESYVAVSVVVEIGFISCVCDFRLFR